jgi:hypothetical protein
MGLSPPVSDPKLLLTTAEEPEPRHIVVISMAFGDVAGVAATLMPPFRFYPVRSAYQPPASSTFL